jgi:hypothetical protein
MHAVIDQEAEMPPHFLVIERLVGVEFGGDGGEYALPARVAHLGISWEKRRPDMEAIQASSLISCKYI